MDLLSRVAGWLGENEATISAVVGITVLAGVLFAGLRSLVRRRGEISREKAPAGSGDAPTAADSSPTDLDPLTVPGFEGRPAIAVLPFDNLCRAIELDPSFARAYRILGSFLASSGKPDEGIALIDKGMRLTPRDPWLAQFLTLKGWAHFVARRYGDAVECLKQGLELVRAPTGYAWLLLAASLAHLDRHEEAAATLREVLTLYEGKLTLDDTRQTYRYLDPDLLERLIDGLRKAGLPEGTEA